VSPSQAPDPLRLPVEEQVVYELGEWPLSLQAAAAEVMAESGIPHGWDRTDLVVQLDHEVAVDAILAEIEGEAAPGELPASDLAEELEDVEQVGEVNDLEDADELEDAERALFAPEGAADQRDEGDDDLGDLEYELDEWNESDRALLTERLTEQRLAFRWEAEDVLVVEAADEEQVEAILDSIEYPDALAVEPEEDEDDDDEARFALLSELFVAADRLKAHPRDPDGIHGLATVLEAADPGEPPYGIDAQLWADALGLADDLADRVAGSADEDGDGIVDGEVDEEGEPIFTDDDVRARAASLREVLRPFV
jgi:hypothetical protein